MSLLTVESTRVDEVTYVRYVTKGGSGKRVHIVTVPQEIAKLLGVYSDLSMALEWSVRTDKAGHRYLRVRGRKNGRRANRSEVNWNGGRSLHTGSRKTTIPAAMAADLRFGESKRCRWVIRPDGEVRVYPYWTLTKRTMNPVKRKRKIASSS